MASREERVFLLGKFSIEAISIQAWQVDVEEQDRQSNLEDFAPTFVFIKYLFEGEEDLCKAHYTAAIVNELFEHFKWIKVA